MIVEKDKIESEFLALLLEARRKGMSSQQFFALADATLQHLKGAVSNETLAKVMDESATPDDVIALLNGLKPGDR